MIELPMWLFFVLVYVSVSLGCLAGYLVGRVEVKP